MLLSFKSGGTGFRGVTSKNPDSRWLKQEGRSPSVKSLFLLTPVWPVSPTGRSCVLDRPPPGQGRVFTAQVLRLLCPGPEEGVTLRLQAGVRGQAWRGRFGHRLLSWACTRPSPPVSPESSSACLGPGLPLVRTHLGWRPAQWPSLLSPLVPKTVAAGCARGQDLQIRISRGRNSAHDRRRRLRSRPRSAVKVLSEEL